MDWTKKTCAICGAVGSGPEPGVLCPECFLEHLTIDIFLDDKRGCPQGWVPYYRTEDVIDALQMWRDEPATNPGIRSISLDNDLGQGAVEGYKVLDWIEEQVILDESFVPPVIHIHTDNPVARQRMISTLHQVQMRLDDRGAEVNVIGE